MRKEGPRPTKFKIFLYSALGFLALGVLSTLFAWTLVRSKELLIASLTLFGVFAVYFIFLVLLSRKTGWRDEKTLPRRIASQEKFLLDGYFGKKHGRETFFLDAYPDGERELFIRRLKGENEGFDSDMGALGALCIGSVALPLEELFALRGKCIALQKEVAARLREDARFAAFARKNEILEY